MLTENTVTKLQEMHLSAMAKAFKDQMTDPNMADMSFEDRFGLLVDHEWTTRKNNHLKRLIKNAGFAESGACVEDIEYHSDRNLDILSFSFSISSSSFTLNGCSGKSSIIATATLRTFSLFASVGEYSSCKVFVSSMRPSK